MEAVAAVSAVSEGVVAAAADETAGRSAVENCAAQAAANVFTGVIMAGRGPQSFKKRQKEQQRKEKREEKMSKRLERKRQASSSSESESESAPAAERPDPEATPLS